AGLVATYMSKRVSRSRTSKQYLSVSSISSCSTLGLSHSLHHRKQTYPLAFPIRTSLTLRTRNPDSTLEKPVSLEPAPETPPKLSTPVKFPPAMLKYLEQEPEEEPWTAVT